MAARTRTVSSGGSYRGHEYRVEQQMVQTLGGKSGNPTWSFIYVDGNKILPRAEFGKPTKEFTGAEQSVRAAQFHIDQLETQKELDRLEDQKHPGTRMVLTIGRTSTRPQKHYEQL